MTSPDAAPNKLQESANALSQQVGQLVLSAHAEGVRQGMECAAQIADTAARHIGDDYSIDAAARAVCVQLLQNMRDWIRLYALQVPEPELPNV